MRATCGWTAAAARIFRPAITGRGFRVFRDILRPAGATVFTARRITDAGISARPIPAEACRWPGSAAILRASSVPAGAGTVVESGWIAGAARTLPWAETTGRHRIGQA